MKRCEFTHSNGRPCDAPVMKGQRWCWHHNPHVAERRAEARRRGGLASAWRLHGPNSNMWDLSTSEGRQRALATITRRLLSGQMSQRKGDALIRAVRTAERFERRIKGETPPKQIIQVNMPAWLKEGITGDPKPNQSDDGKPA